MYHCTCFFSLGSGWFFANWALYIYLKNIIFDMYLLYILLTTGCYILFARSWHFNVIPIDFTIAILVTHSYREFSVQYAKVNIFLWFIISDYMKLNHWSFFFFVWLYVDHMTMLDFCSSFWRIGLFASSFVEGR